VPHTKYYKTVEAKLEGTYKISDGKGRQLDSGDVDENFTRDYENGTDEVPFGVAELSRVRLPLVGIGGHVRQVCGAEDGQRRLAGGGRQLLFRERSGDPMPLVSPGER